MVCTTLVNTGLGLNTSINWFDQSINKIRSVLLTLGQSGMISQIITHFPLFTDLVHATAIIHSEIGQ